MKQRLIPIFLTLFILAFTGARSQSANWPRTFKTSGGSEIRMYEPQPESYNGNLVKIRAAVSVIPQGKTDPVFGVIWADVSLSNSSNGKLRWEQANVTNLKLPGEDNQSAQDELIAAIESGVPDLQITTSESELKEKLSESEKENKLANNLSTAPPKIIYTRTPSMLVLIDGQPQFEKNTAWGVEQVINTPFTMVKTGSQQFYLYGGKKWYDARSYTGPWNYVQNVPSSLSKMNDDVRASDTSATTADENIIPEIIVSTEPAELIQSKGEANFSPIQGTNLLYMSNSANDIFMDVNSQQYFVLISGRWYQAPSLSSSWKYVSPSSLPADFTKIPEGSAKDGVLASVAGTSAARESVMDAQVPQTARVDRKTATAKVTYDGEPQFENIQGTNLKYATNTPGAVLNDGRQYYYVENGVWFQSSNPGGPWYVSTNRPAQVDYIPASYPVYNVKYVYIYDATPDYVYMGYTPGYLGAYVYGPTLVYGTGYYYKPWRGRYYYPRLTTWGYNMRYSPWTGWGFGIDLWAGWLSIHIGNYHRGPQWGGWWGPPVYRPVYVRYNNYYGYNSRSRSYQYSNRSSNVYRYRRDVVTYDRPRDYGRGNNNSYGVDRPTRNGSTRPGRDYSDSRPNNNRNSNQGAVTPGNRPVTRNYDPVAQPRNRNYDNGSNSNFPGNNNPVRNRSTNPVQPGGNSRIYSPESNNSNSQNRANTPDRQIETRQSRPVAPDFGTPAPQRERTMRDPGERVQPQRQLEGRAERMPQQQRSNDVQQAPQRERSAPQQQERPQSSPGVSRPQREGSSGERPSVSDERRGDRRRNG